MAELLYIAETDENGHIEAVWVVRQNARGPKPFDPLEVRFDPRQPAEFSGAPRMAVMSWLAARQSLV